MFIPLFIAILLGLASPSNTNTNCNHNGNGTTITTNDAPDDGGENPGEGGTGGELPGDGTGGETGNNPPRE